MGFYNMEYILMNKSGKRTDSEREAFRQGRYTGLTEASNLLEKYRGVCVPRNLNDNINLKCSEMADKIRKLRPNLI